MFGRSEEISSDLLLQATPLRVNFVLSMPEGCDVLLSPRPRPHRTAARLGTWKINDSNGKADLICPNSRPLHVVACRGASV